MSRRVSEDVMLPYRADSGVCVTCQALSSPSCANKMSRPAFYIRSEQIKVWGTGTINPDVLFGLLETAGPFNSSKNRPYIKNIHNYSFDNSGYLNAENKSELDFSKWQINCIYIEPLKALYSTTSIHQFTHTHSYIFYHTPSYTIRRREQSRVQYHALRHGLEELEI